MAIADKLRMALNSRGKESYRAIARAIGLDHAMLLRFADGRKSLSLDSADRLSPYLGMELESKGIYVEVIYPEAMRKRVGNKTFCLWHSRSRFKVPICDERPNGSSSWEDIFGPFSSVEKAEQFSDYTINFLEKWTDYCDGEMYQVCQLKADLQTCIGERNAGMIGSNAAKR